MIFRPKSWYQQSLYNGTDYPRLLRTILKDATPSVSDNKDKLTDQKEIITAAPFKIDVKNRQLTYKKKVLEFDDISLIQINHHRISLYQNGRKSISFKYKNTAYEEYIPVLCRYMGNRVEMI
ncbi:MAG: hypothetical protein ACJAYJ_002491 [Saprospiraceae bacterium]|jgi:hypothetical protein